MIISIDTEKAFNKIEHLVIIKIRKWRAEKFFFSLIKDIYEKNPTNIIVVKDWDFSPKTRTRQRFLFALLLLFNTVLEVLPRVIRQEKEINNLFRKEEVKLFIFMDDMNLKNTHEHKGKCN